MADRVPLTVTENNDETVELTINRADTDDDLTSVAVLQFVLKADECDADDAATSLILSTTVPAEMSITAQSAAQILALAFIPRSALQGSWPRVYHVDGLTGAGARRTALFGPVTVNAL